ncbi:double-strand break repair helicase AddA [Geminicoccus roseus]|uniref:double-strand break repair helicase AddA n=1 Tax=Geminicoccus roseus TaxID=404900 RepID=UPI000400B77A|nr:double-strand break repair helicase AddA [Geminicoccus roseus]
MSWKLPPPPTPAQRDAADPTCSVWVTANAGTGKTRVLADRVLRLLLAGSPPDTILGLTFTKAAAAEMIERIEARLAAWSGAAEPELVADLEGVLGRAPTRDEIRGARGLFDRVLDLPSGLSISTIHSLASSLLRRFPLEAGVSPHFSVIDERTAAERLAAAKAALFEAASVEGSAMAKVVGRLAERFADQTIDDAISEVIRLRRHLLELGGGDSGTDRILAAVAKALGAGRSRTELLVQACADAAFERNGLLKVQAALATGSKLYLARAERLDSWLKAADAGARAAGWSAYARAWTTADGGPIKDMLTAAMKKADLALAEHCRVEQERVLAVQEELVALECAEVTGAVLAAGMFAIAHAEQQKAFEGELDYDDLIALAGRLLADSSVRDWVLYKLDARIDHVLVDEAQDTSPAQWAIIERLVEDFFTGETAGGRNRTLFVVGDEKQSIYGFQGADLASLQEVRARLEARAAGAGRPIRTVVLDTSFRSTEAVLEVVDQVFLAEDARPGVMADNLVMRHATSRGGAPGLVGVWPLAPGDDRMTYDPWQPGTRPDLVETGQQKVASAIATFIQNSLARRLPLDSSGQQLRAQEFLVLVRKRGRIQDLVIRALKRRGIPVAGADRFTLVEHLAVRDLLALGAVLALPEDDLSLACVLKSPLIELSEDDLFALAHDRGKTSLIERLRAFAESGGERFAQAYGRLREWIRRADFMPPYELFCHVLGTSGARERFVERMGREVVEPLEAFLGECLAYERGHPASLSGFLHWLAASDAQLKRDPESARDEVRVLTVHGSKGLEAPVVILADAGPGGGGRQGSLIRDPESGLVFLRGSKGSRPPLVERLVEAEARRDEEEARRLLYVALTRARDRLYLAGWGEESDKGEPSWHGRVRAALEAAGGAERGVDAVGALLGGEVLTRRRGDPGPPVAVPAEVRAAATAMPEPSWLRTSARAEPATARSLAPSRAGGDDPPARGAGLAARAFGLHAHRLLQILPELDETQRDPALDRYLARVATDLEPDMQERLREQVLAVLAHPDLRPLFGPGSRAEQAITGTIAGVAVNGQIDRLAIGIDAIHLVDFKTARLPPDRVEDTPVAYLRQLSAYAALLERRFPNRPIHASLVWTDTLSVVPLPVELLRRHLPVPLDAGLP